MMALCAFPSSCLDLLCRRHLCALHTYGYIHQLTVSLFSYGCPVPILLLKGTPESSGLPAPLLHVIFICLIKANLIRQEWQRCIKAPVNPGHGLIQERAFVSRPPGSSQLGDRSPRGVGREAKPKKGVLLGQARLTSLGGPFANKPERNQRKKLKNEKTLKITGERPCKNGAQRANCGLEFWPLSHHLSL